MKKKREYLNVAKKVLSVSGLIMALVLGFGMREKSICTEKEILVDYGPNKSFIRTQEIETMIENWCSDVHAVGDLKILENRFSALPQLRQAQVWVGVDQTLFVDLKQRNAIALIENNKGEHLYLDAEGVLMPSGLGDPSHCLFVNGHLPLRSSEESIEDSPMLAEIFSLVSFIHNHNVWAPLIQQIYVLPDTQFVLIPSMGSHEILLGNIEFAEKKLNKLYHFYRFVLSEEGWNLYKTIDLRFAGQIVCSKSNYPY
jgi:cell division protein FtsQ